MRFLQFLLEGEASSENAILKMESACIPFLKEQGSRKNILWRGMSRRFELSNNHMVDVKKDRRPLDTQLELHHALDDWFLDNFGFRARSNAVFASGSENFALVYGDLYAIYPIGDFEYVWSPRIKDTLLLDQEANHLLARIEQKSGTKFDKEEWLEQKANIIIDLLEKGRYSDTNLKAAIASGSEIMIHCDKYYAFAKNDPVWQEWSGYKDKFKD